MLYVIEDVKIVYNIIAGFIEFFWSFEWKIEFFGCMPKICLLHQEKVKVVGNFFF